MISCPLSGSVEAKFDQITDTVQFWPTGMLPEMHDSCETLKSSLVVKIFPIVRTSVPVLVIVTVCGALLPSAGTGANPKLVGEILANAPETPVPDSETGCGLSPALSLKFNEPWIIPPDCGENATSIVQLAPAATDVPHVLFASVKLFESAATETPLSAALPTFVKVTVCAVLCVPWLTLPNARPVGASDTTELERLPALMKTLESTSSSIASAIASLMWFVTPGFTGALAVNTTVKPSISVSNGGLVNTSMSLFT